MNHAILTVNLPAVQIARNGLLPPIEIVWRIPKNMQIGKYHVHKVNPKHVERAIASIRKFGFSQPVLIHSTEIVGGPIKVNAARS